MPPGRRGLPPKLQRTAVRTSAVAFWALAIITEASYFIGPGQHINFLITGVMTGLGVVFGFALWFLPAERLPAERLLSACLAGVVMLTISVLATGGARSHLTALYPMIVVFTASVLPLRTAAWVALIAAAAALIPLLYGWDGFYVRTWVILVAAMGISAYLPARVREALSVENGLAEQRRRELEESYLATIEGLAAALDAKDRHTEAHSRETVALARAVGRRLGLEEESRRFLEYAALLHDIGKIGIPGYVLNKPGPLDDEEMAIMREHPVIGERILATVPFLARIRPVVRAEHERWDGAGYPDGLAGTEIPIEARIIHACDALQAMASDRPYRRALPRAAILSELRGQSGKQFDPAVVAALLDVLESGEVATLGTAAVARHEDHPVPEHAWTRHLDAIQELSSRLASFTKLHEVLELMGRAITTLLPYDQCRFYLLEDDGETLRCAYFSDTGTREYEGITAEGLALKVGEGITGWVAETRHGVMVGDTERHPKAMHVPGTDDAPESMLAVPVAFEDRLVGVIVAVKLGLHQYSPDQLRLLTILANQAAVSIANARLVERLAASAASDPLTGLYNRRAFEEHLEERLRRTDESLTVVMIDVDGLKQVNDARGHSAGDAVLRRVAAVLREHVRSQDRVSRWGGDEFLLLLPDTDQVGAASLARRISGSLQTPVDGIGPISISVGVASRPGDGTTADELLAAADRGMYAEKRLRAA